MIFNALEVDLDDILLLFRGRVLKDEQTISQCNITANDTILLVVHKKPEESRMIFLCSHLAPDHSERTQTADEDNTTEIMNEIHDVFDGV